ncbi:hypothetical protein SAMN05428974_1854 [Sphingopyxis sp. YR583]|uniref:hypothetical protein n=1 Tax=Sphingopyxis sp. YR583 TaxID=1881047 RepID=UPI0008A72AA2|nr:hypothetical protein [Sphingopyxis sp. YR583]SEH16733.1 hypothetical protein SAMN05428974_1854 [Sphingopyxis sp. YR583]
MRGQAGLMMGAMLALAGCGDAKAPTAPEKSVLADGPKADISKLAATDLPAGVRDAVLARVPGMTIAEAERKERDGKIFFDVEGTRPDGSAVELDLIEEDGKYRVVEMQRDIAWTSAPAPVRAAADAFTPARVIESTQEDGTIVYELFAPGKADEPAAEVNWKDGKAALRTTRNEY